MKYVVKRKIGYTWMDGVVDAGTFNSLDEAKKFIDLVTEPGFDKYDYFVLYGRGNRKMAKYNLPSGDWVVE